MQLTGAQIVIVATNENYAMSTTQQSNNRTSAAVTKDKSNNTVTFGSDVQIITLKGSAGAWEFYVTGNTTGYLYAASTSSNHLKTQATNNSKGQWTIAVTSAGVATIKSVGNTSRGWLRFNTQNSPKLFACYGSGQTDVGIYVYA